MSNKLQYRPERHSYKKLDGVIVTLNDNFNYGNIAQRYALQEYLRKKGYSFVSYKNTPTEESSDDLIRFRNTSAFVEKNIKQKDYDPRDKFSIYIVGSDQVWRNWGYKDEKKDLGYFFLDFVDNPNAKKIAYGASIGKDTLKEASVSREFINYTQPFVEEFDAIFMRESAGVKSVQDTWGVKSRQVLDPVMLLMADDYDGLINSSPSRLKTTKPIFTYILATDSTKNTFVQTIEKSINRESDGFLVDQMDVMPSVEQWLKGFRDSELVVTDSFYGLAFSIIYNTSFVIIENEGKEAARISNVLSEFGLEDRLVMAEDAAQFDIAKLKPIDWIEVNKRLDILRDRSAFWLLGALNKQKIGSIRRYNSKQRPAFNLHDIIIFFGKARRWTIANIIRYTQPYIPKPIRRFLMKANHKFENSVLSKILSRKVIVANPVHDSNNPLVSVISPYYNCAATIQETLNSVLNQTLQDFEYIIIDDGSTPHEAKALDSINHPKVRIVHLQNNIGNGSPAAARNVGVLMAKGRYIVCLDADDTIEPTYLEKGVIALETHPWLGLFSTNTNAFGEVNEIWEYTHYDPKELFTNNMITTAAMYRKEIWEKLGGYKEDIGYEDWEMWINMAEHGHFAFRLKEPLFNYRTAISSRFVDDRSKHKDIVSRIRALHPRYSSNVRLLKHYAKRKVHEVETVTAFQNLSRPEIYTRQDNNKPNILVAMPWMTFGGAETLISNFCNEVKDTYNLSFVTGLESSHEWEYKFKALTPNIFHLANLFSNRKMYLEFLSNYIQTRNISVLHIIHTDFLFGMIGDLKKRHPHLKVVVTVFNDKVYLEEAVGESDDVDVYTTDNLAVQQRYERELNKAGRKGVVKVIPNGINTAEIFNSKRHDREKRRVELGLQKDDLAVFFIGRLSKEKNPDVFVEAAKKTLGKDAEKIKFYVIGDGNMRGKIESDIKKSGQKDKINYLGYQSDIAGYLCAADVFVLPSSTEGFPLSILEAMAMKVVVVASDVGAVSDVVEHEVDGFVIEPGSAKEIESTIRKIEKNRAMLNEMKQKSRKKVESKYSNEVLGRNYIELYEGVMK